MKFGTFNGNMFKWRLALFKSNHQHMRKKTLDTFIGDCYDNRRSNGTKEIKLAVFFKRSHSLYPNKTHSVSVSQRSDQMKQKIHFFVPFAFGFRSDASF